MKKIISISIAVIMLLSCLCACGTNTGNSSPTDAQGEKKLSIVTTVFPIYDWIRNILGENYTQDLTMLLDSGVDLHSFQPTVADIAKISTCDIFVYVGGESDAWAEKVLQQSENKEMTVINLMDALGENAKEEEEKEGMEAEEAEEEEELSAVEYDEHIWLSLKNAEILSTVICEKLGEKDAENKAAYEANLSSYCERLNALDQEYQEAVNGAKYHTLVFGDRFPFRYLFSDYGLDYYAAFKGCSAESEASFNTIRFLAQKIDENMLDCIMKIESSADDIANSVIEATTDKNQTIITLNSLQNITAKNVEEGVTYLSVMESNLDSLKEALN